MSSDMELNGNYLCYLKKKDNLFYFYRCILVIETISHII